MDPLKALFGLLVVDAAARYVMARNQVFGWRVSLLVCPFWVAATVLGGYPWAAFLALPWAIAAAINIRRAKRARAQAAAAAAPAPEPVVEE